MNTILHPPRLSLLLLPLLTLLLPFLLSPLLLILLRSLLLLQTFLPTDSRRRRPRRHRPRKTLTRTLTRICRQNPTLTPIDSLPPSLLPIPSLSLKMQKPFTRRSTSVALASSLPIILENPSRLKTYQPSLILSSFRNHNPSTNHPPINPLLLPR